MKVAVVHEWLVTYAGSERVLEQILKEYPEADLFATVDFLPDSDRGFLQGKRPTTSFIQKMPGAAKHYQKYLPLMPLAVEQFDLRSYDLVISSSHAVAKGVITGPDQLHVSYVHSPIRYAWDLQHQYLQESGLARGFKSWVARAMLHYLRVWDTRTANGVDHFIANSRFIAKRLQKVYRRDSDVIYPPVDLARFSVHGTKEEFFLTASRLTPYKKVATIVEAFAKMPDRQLIVIGDGPEMARVRAVAGPNVRLLGYQSTEVLVDHMRRARAFVFAAEEDFGITPVEAQACGTPVIAYGKGGSLETVRVSPSTPEATTGAFFSEQTAASIVRAVEDFASRDPISATACRSQAERFSESQFRSELRACIDGLLAARQSAQGLVEDKNGRG